jgi:hypothetical protein
MRDFQESAHGQWIWKIWRCQAQGPGAEIRAEGQRGTEKKEKDMISGTLWNLLNYHR